MLVVGNSVTRIAVSIVELTGMQLMHVPWSDATSCYVPGQHSDEWKNQQSKDRNTAIVLVYEQQPLSFPTCTSY